MIGFGEKKLYYISDIASASEIQAKGITADINGLIDIFEVIKESINDAVNIASYIAKNQMFLDEYVLFEIKEKGITGKIINNKISGKTGSFQKTIKQRNIDKENIKFINIFKAGISI